MYVVMIVSFFRTIPNFTTTTTTTTTTITHKEEEEEDKSEKSEEMYGEEIGEERIKEE